LGQDILFGGDGNDNLNAQQGGDTLVGGAGNDIFSFDDESLDGLDVIVDFNGLPGFDELSVSGLLKGVSAANADDFLRTDTSGGETTVQVDLDGGADNFVDLVVLAGVSTDLDGLIANAALRGIGGLSATPVTGTSGGDTLAGATTSTLVQGLAGTDSLTGGAGFDTLDGGSGTDTLVGGAGSDTYIVDSAKDVVVDVSGDDDRVLASIAIDLQSSTYDGIEHVTLTGTAALNVTGDEGENAIFGNAGANKLDGKGGGDVLAGGAGNDTYEVDNVADVVFENPGEGTDQVNSSVSHVLRDNVENLTLTGAAASGSGNDSANKITGNAQANFLNGGGGNDTLTGSDGADNINGGAGADSMSGGADDDFYIVDDAGDRIAESGAGGTDTVGSSITYTLGANLEDLRLADTAAIDGTGNTLGNAIAGNDGDNVLSGLAGNDTLEGSDGSDLLLGGDGNDELFIDAGADTVVGGSGSDAFVFGPVLSGVDVIADFNGGPGGDLIDLTSLLNGFDPDSSNVHDYLQTVVEDGSTVLRIDANGAGTSFVDAALLQGVSTDVMALVSNGSIEFPS
jgi:Ca2+-binding RTX toxin-like protein